MLQGPALLLGDDSIQSAMPVLDRSLNWLRHRFEAVPTTVVYVPSPLSVYHLAEEEVSYCLYAVNSAPADKVEAHSDLISSLVAKSAASQGFQFLDARSALRAVAANTIIHGPRDWDHFNEAGYRALGALVASRVTARP